MTVSASDPPKAADPAVPVAAPKVARAIRVPKRFAQAGCPARRGDLGERAAPLGLCTEGTGVWHSTLRGDGGAVRLRRRGALVGARMEVKGRRIQAPLSPRDSTFQAEHLWISLDTYHDKRTSYSYGVSASGVRMDFFNKSDNEMDLDEDYNPVWQAKAARSETNWSAEFRIPFRSFDSPSETTTFASCHSAAMWSCAGSIGPAARCMWSGRRTAPTPPPSRGRVSPPSWTQSPPKATTSSR